MCHSLVHPHVRFLFNNVPMPNPRMHTNHYIRENDFRSTLLHKMTTCIIILNLSQITTVQFSSKPLIEFTYQAAKISHQNNKQSKCSLHQQDWELPALKSMICLQSLLYSSCCCFLNFSNSLSVFYAFLFSWSTCSPRTAEFFWWVASRSRSLEQLFWYQHSSKKLCCSWPRRGPQKQHQQQVLLV
jgi:hypothetical protein